MGTGSGNLDATLNPAVNAANPTMDLVIEAVSSFHDILLSMNLMKSGTVLINISVVFTCLLYTSCSDCAHSFGGYRIKEGKKVMCGAMADFSSFSFHAVKNFTTAEGGALTWHLPFGEEPVVLDLDLNQDKNFSKVSMNEGNNWNQRIYRICQLLSLSLIHIFLPRTWQESDDIPQRTLWARCSTFANTHH